MFFATGAVGLAWTLWWVRDYRTPAASAASADAGRRQRVAVGYACSGSARSGAWSIAKFLSDAAWYFYLFWLPKYLYDVRGFDVKRVGAYAWIPYAAAGVGCLLGGWFSSWLLTRGASVNVARKLGARRERGADAAHRLRHACADQRRRSCCSASRSSASSRGPRWS